MGNQLARTTQVSPSDYYLHDLPNNVVYKATLGGGRFLKTVQCVHDEGLVVAKVYFKRGDTPTLRVRCDILNSERFVDEHSHSFNSAD
jgi:phosphoinositide-3-kinase regulatory subunit 4